MAEQYSGFMSSGTKLFLKFQMPTSGATLEQKNGALELTKLEYPLFFIHVAPDHLRLEFKKTDWYPSS